eukprot:759204-Hanusia_phi.AAC.3
MVRKGSVVTKKLPGGWGQDALEVWVVSGAKVSGSKDWRGSLLAQGSRRDVNVRARAHYSTGQSPGERISPTSEICGKGGWAIVRCCSLEPV